MFGPQFSACSSWVQVPFSWTFAACLPYFYAIHYQVKGYTEIRNIEICLVELNNLDKIFLQKREGDQGFKLYSSNFTAFVPIYKLNNHNTSGLVSFADFMAKSRRQTLTTAVLLLFQGSLALDGVELCFRV